MAPSTAGLAGAVAKLPSFFLQKGSFTATQRAACFAYKASCFWFIGFITSVRFSESPALDTRELVALTIVGPVPEIPDQGSGTPPGHPAAPSRMPLFCCPTRCSARLINPVAAQPLDLPVAPQALGHSVTKALIEARGQSTAHMASVWDNSVQWGNFLGASSNLRWAALPETLPDKDNAKGSREEPSGTFLPSDFPSFA